MAWYYGTFSCGHEGRVNVIGKEKDRQWKIDRKFEGVCEDCYREQREAERAKALEYAKSDAEKEGLPQLIGSEKQINWAMQIRDEFLKLLEYEPRVQEWAANAKIEIEEVEDAFSYWAQKQTAAKYWIDARLKLGFEETWRYIVFVYRDREAVEPEEEIKESSVIFPENYNHTTPVEIVVEERKVDVISEKDDTLIKLVKDLGYSWTCSVWRKRITHTTGSAQERAGEVGNKLLNLGYAVLIVDEIAKNKAINADYEPECTRWVDLRIDGKLLIRWSEFNRSLYEKAKSLKGAKYENGAVIVNVAHGHDVEEFARLYGFNITSKAIKAIEAFEEQATHSIHIEEAKDACIEDGLEKILESKAEILPDLMDD